MKKNKTSYQNLEQLETTPTCLDKFEVKVNSCFGCLWLFFTGYFFLYFYNTYLNEKKNINVYK